MYVTKRYPIDASTIYYAEMDKDISMQLMTEETYVAQMESNFKNHYDMDIDVNLQSFEKIKISGGQRIVPLEARLRSAKNRSGTKFKSRRASFSLSTDVFPGPPQERYLLNLVPLRFFAERKRASKGTIRCPDTSQSQPLNETFFETFFLNPPLTFPASYDIVSKCAKAHKSKAEYPLSPCGDRAVPDTSQSQPPL